MNELLPETRNTACPPKHVEQQHVLTTTRNVSAVNDHLCSVKNTETFPIPNDQTIPQNTLYDSQMEMTMVDNIAEIATVQTKAKKRSEDNQETSLKSTESFFAERKSTMSANVEMPAYLNMAVIPSVEAFSKVQNMNICSSSNEEEHLQEHVETLPGATESVATRRKTPVTSRNAKSKRTRESQKHTESHVDTRKTYEVSSHSLNSVSSIHDDYFSDLEVQCKEKESEEMSCDVHFFDDKHAESEGGTCIVTKPQNNRTKSRPKKSRETRVSSFSLDANASCVKENTVHTPATVDTDAHVTEISMQAEDIPLSQTKEANTVKNRGTYIIHSRQTYMYGDILNDAVDLQDVSYGEIAANARELEPKNDSQRTCAPLVLTEGAQLEQGDSSVLSNKSFRKHPSAHNDKNPLENASKHPHVGQPESKNPKTEVKVKARKKNAAGRDKNNAVRKRRGENRSSTQNADIFVTELWCPVDSYNQQESTSSCTAFPQSTRASQCSVLEACSRDAPRRQTGNADNIHSVDIEHSDDVGTINDFGKRMKGVSSRPQKNVAHKSKCRKTYVVPSCELFQAKENSMIFNRSSEDRLLPNEGGEISLVTDERTFNPHRNSDNQSTPKTTKRVRQDPKDLLCEERPPWEDLDLACDSLYSDHSPSKEISRTVEKSEEPGWSSRHQSPGNSSYFFLKHLKLCHVYCWEERLAKFHL